MLTRELKAKCIAELQAYVKGFQKRRPAVTDEGKPQPDRFFLAKEAVTDIPATDGAPSKNALKKAAKQKAIQEGKAAAEALRALVRR
ncbi:hypothetical protein HYFRA_00002924 [Hymenoscyphus fraxineus]|uniref:Uncharacterized protein n=1 Tax=Hymenoscyphus fraxineus TaxID=746836 RepID=A0A9N9KMY2_9HELO|nr:hypothetical protein HYFRA_00002924 [Hymenoscyphus fraxineus]